MFYNKFVKDSSNLSFVVSAVILMAALLYISFLNPSDKMLPLKNVILVCFLSKEGKRISNFLFLNFQSIYLRFKFKLSLFWKDYTSS
jgi:hypothetical protein